MSENTGMLAFLAGVFGVVIGVLIVIHNDLVSLNDSINAPHSISVEGNTQ